VFEALIELPTSPKRGTGATPHLPASSGFDLTVAVIQTPEITDATSPDRNDPVYSVQPLTCLEMGDCRRRPYSSTDFSKTGLPTRFASPFSSKYQLPADCIM
jgi:hypothetical protein